MSTEYFLYGAGGHAKVVLDAMLCQNIKLCVYDDDKKKQGKQLLGVVVEQYEKHSGDPKYGHLAIGDNRLREILFERLDGSIGSWFSIIHPLAAVSSNCTIEEGVFIAAQSTVGPECKIATATIINHGAIVDHDCNVGRFCHIAPNATLGGGVTLENGALIGSGAVILPGLSIGENAKVGAGAVVTKNVRSGAVVVGVPARSLS